MLCLKVAILDHFSSRDIESLRVNQRRDQMVQLAHDMLIHLVVTSLE